MTSSARVSPPPPLLHCAVMFQGAKILPVVVMLNPELNGYTLKACFDACTKKGRMDADVARRWDAFSDHEVKGDLF